MATREVGGSVAVGDASVSTATIAARTPVATLIVAHGAGAGMDSPFLVGFSAAMAEAKVTTVRFNFRYVELGRKAPDREPMLREAWLAVFADVAARARVPVFAGGKSLGGRIASMCVADGMPAAGLVFLGYPLHPPGRPERLRAEHLERVDVPMLFIEGTRDPFADPPTLARVLERLDDRATLATVEGGDHSFKVPGPKVDAARIGAALAAIAAPFVRRVAGER
jgi:predicted alpha/beta-hydrolase family hydrolase